jgi:hypothetical protein
MKLALRYQGDHHSQFDGDHHRKQIQLLPTYDLRFRPNPIFLAISDLFAAYNGATIG